MGILSVNTFCLVYRRIHVSEIQHRNYTIQNVCTIHFYTSWLVLLNFKHHQLFLSELFRMFSICCNVCLIFKVDFIKLKFLNEQLLRVHPHVKVISLVIQWAKETSEKKLFLYPLTIWPHVDFFLMVTWAFEICTDIPCLKISLLSYLVAPHSWELTDKGLYSTNCLKKLD